MILQWFFQDFWSPSTSWIFKGHPEISFSPWFFHQKWFSDRFFCIFPEYSRVQQLPSSRAPTGCQKSLYGCPKVENGLFFHRLRNSKNPLFWGTWWHFWALLHQLMNHTFRSFCYYSPLCHPSDVPCKKKSCRTSFGEVLSILRKIKPTIQGYPAFSFQCWLKGLLKKLKTHVEKSWVLIFQKTGDQNCHPTPNTDEHQKIYTNTLGTRKSPF